MIKTSESVLRGHPDKICDQVADYILTELIKQDKDTIAGIECLIKDELLVIAGEVTTKAVVFFNSSINFVSFLIHLILPLEFQLPYQQVFLLSHF